eukprot:TRINITY_DN4836_c0_g1_i1.p1 TRINITY_DN4836_c0_g1~~TRINITY_DN4836_c0_g1_i1.p1  ORF type:complete len:878 (-),score=143.59 TRINITY_DN4836_c0_g1_i1:1032-3614(-)
MLRHLSLCEGSFKCFSRGSIYPRIKRYGTTSVEQGRPQEYVLTTYKESPPLTRSVPVYNYRSGEVVALLWSGRTMLAVVKEFVLLPRSVIVTVPESLYHKSVTMALSDQCVLESFGSDLTLDDYRAKIKELTLSVSMNQIHLLEQSYQNEDGKNWFTIDEALDVFFSKDTRCNYSMPLLRYSARLILYRYWTLFGSRSPTIFYTFSRNIKRNFFTANKFLSNPTELDSWLASARAILLQGRNSRLWESEFRRIDYKGIKVMGKGVVNKSVGGDDDSNIFTGGGDDPKSVNYQYLYDKHLETLLNRSRTKKSPTPSFTGEADSNDTKVGDWNLTLEEKKKLLLGDLSGDALMTMLIFFANKTHGFFKCPRLESTVVKLLGVKDLNDFLMDLEIFPAGETPFEIYYKFFPQIDAYGPCMVPHINSARGGIQKTSSKTLGSRMEQMVTSLYDRTQKFKSMSSPLIMDTLSLRNRTDLTHHVAYAIDDPSSEADDAISWEKKSDGSYWIHVHIADPTHTLQPNSVLDLDARRRSSSLYFPHTVYWMFPRDFTQTLSLRTDSTHPTLTFSGKIDLETGRLMDYNVVESLSSVKRISYAELQAILEENDVRDGIFRSNPPTSRHSVPKVLFKEEHDQLCDYFSFLENFAEKRKVLRAEGSALSNRSFSPVECKVSNGRIWIEDYSVQSRARSIVEECMIFAGELAANFAVRNNIPFVFRSLPFPLVDGSPSLEGIEDPIIQLKLRLPYSNAAFHSVTPDKHELIGVEYYTRVTSPLRRYPDLLNHFQIKSFLKGGTSGLQFTDVELKNYLNMIDYTLLKNNQLMNFQWKRHQDNRAKADNETVQRKGLPSDQHPQEDFVMFLEWTS